MLDRDPILLDQQQVGERWNAAIHPRFVAQIVVSSPWRQYVHNHLRVRHRIALFVDAFRWTANHCHIRIGVRTAAVYANSNVAAINTTLASGKVSIQLSS